MTQVWDVPHGSSICKRVQGHMEIPQSCDAPTHSEWGEIHLLILIYAEGASEMLWKRREKGSTKKRVPHSSFAPVHTSSSYQISLTKLRFKHKIIKISRRQQQSMKSVTGPSECASLTIGVRCWSSLMWPITCFLPAGLRLALEILGWSIFTVWNTIITKINDNSEGKMSLRYMSLQL